MEVTSIYTAIITVVTVLGSASAWRFYEKRATAKEKSDNLNDEVQLLLVD
jgi:hypothetical protein